MVEGERPPGQDEAGGFDAEQPRPKKPRSTVEQIRERKMREHDIRQQRRAANELERDRMKTDKAAVHQEEARRRQEILAAKQAKVRFRAAANSEISVPSKKYDYSGK